MSKNYFTKGPSNIPEGFTRPGKRFKIRVALAMLGLFSFALVYFYMMIWFFTQALELFKLAPTSDSEFFHIITGICFIVLSIFMVKSLIFFNKRSKIPYEEITRENEPELVEFIHQVAEEIGAPKPRHIYMSDRVNASVFYDLSFLNLLLPTKKNLEIGLGLMNVLNMTEFKAILAHEFGHFSQRSMLFGRYVYIAQQVASRIVYKRDLLDKGLALLSGIDIRIAWIGWILSIIVWAIRAFIEVLFGLVVISERALSREMEFHADKVAVSVTGSDPLVFALHKLRAADEGYHAGIDVLNKLINRDQIAENLYVLQTNYIARKRQILDDPDYGATPIERRGANKQVFENALINPPEMWATHPADMDREKNAKAQYIPHEIDQRSALEVLRNPEESCKHITSWLIKNAEITKELTMVSNEEACALMDRNHFNWGFLQAKYKGWYLNRRPMLLFKSVDELLADETGLRAGAHIDAVYTEQMKEDLDYCTELEEEVNALNAALAQVRTAENSKIVHRGVQVRRRKIPEIIRQLEMQWKDAQEKVKKYERGIHGALYANLLAQDREEAAYLKSLFTLWHFAEHSTRVLEEENKHLQHSLFVVLADGKVSEDEILRLTNDCKLMQRPMMRAVNRIKESQLSTSILNRLEMSSSSDFFGDLEIQEPYRNDLQQWVNNYEHQLEFILLRLSQLRNVVLEEILAIEDGVLEAQLPKAAVSGAMKVPGEYETMMVDERREMSSKLRFWDKFQGGIGLFPTIAKFSAGGAIIFLAMFVGSTSRESDVYIHNGLNNNVVIEFAGTEYAMLPGEDIMLSGSGEVEITARLENGDLIESFTAEMEGGAYRYVYNVAGASYLMHYQIVYGEVFSNTEPTYIGPVRWMEVDADYIFEDPPEQLYLENSEIRTLLHHNDGSFPENYLTPEEISGKPEVKAMIETHALFDSPQHPNSFHWLYLCAELKEGDRILASRLKRFPDDINVWRLKMDRASSEEKMDMVRDFEFKYKRTNNSNYLYLSIRAREDSLQAEAFLEAWKLHPSNAWIAQACGFEYAHRHEYALALDAYEKACDTDPVVRGYALDTRYRIDRLVNGHLSDVAFRFYNDDPSLVAAQQLEEGQMEVDERDNTGYFYALLKDGSLDLAGATLDLIEEENSMGWLLAASRGVNEEISKAVYTSDPPILTDRQTIACAVGMYARIGRENELIARFNELVDMDKGDRTVKEVISLLRKNQMEAAASRMQKVENFWTELELKKMACVLLGEQAPKEWAREVKRFFYVWERPWLGSDLELSN